MENLIWVLGAPDPEMEAIEALLRECGQVVTYATIDGRRVTPAEAYRSNQRFHSGATFVRVECSWEGAEGPICDHHNPGDHGYGRPPASYWSASSIGQVVQELSRLGVLPAGWEDYPQQIWCGDSSLVPMWALMIAAADHCLAAAYRGECPDVDPDRLMRWRAESRAKFQNRHPQAVLADVSVAVVALMAAPEVVLEVTPGGHCGGESGSCGCRSGGYGYGGDTGGGNGDCYCDCRGCEAGDHYVLALDMRGVHVPELPEASARLGMCFVADGLPGRDGRVKVVCQSGSPEQIDAFMRVFGPSIGLVDIYGDPARGFAGGYHPATA